MRLKEGDSLICHNNGNLHNQQLSTTQHHHLNQRNQHDQNHHHDRSTVNDTGGGGSLLLSDTAQWSFGNNITNIANSNLTTLYQRDVTTTTTTAEPREEEDRRNNLLQNINNNLASNLAAQQEQQERGGCLQRPRRNVTTSSLCSESSPDDSLLDYEEAHQSCSSVETSPQGHEDRCFELSDSESLSDDGNLSGHSNIGSESLVRTWGIVNPNYPGFQHLAHTLEYSIKSHNLQASDTDFTDDDLDIDPVVPLNLNVDENNINNNNNNNNNNDEDDVEFKIDSVNRLDSVENIQKVFYDKPKFNIQLDCENTSASNAESEGEEIDANVNQNVENESSNDDAEQSSNDEEKAVPNVDEIGPSNAVASDNVSAVIVGKSISCNDIIGDFGKEIEVEIGRIVARNAEVVVLEEDVEKLSLSPDKDLSPIKYNIEPNIGESFGKASADFEKLNKEINILEPSKHIETEPLEKFNGNFSEVLVKELNTPKSETVTELLSKVDEKTKSEINIASVEDIKSNIETKSSVKGELKLQENDVLKCEINQVFEKVGKESSGENKTTFKSVEEGSHINRKELSLPIKLHQTFEKFDCKEETILKKSRPERIKSDIVCKIGADVPNPKPKPIISAEILDNLSNMATLTMAAIPSNDNIKGKMADAFLSDTREDLVAVGETKLKENEITIMSDSNRELEERSSKEVEAMQVEKVEVEKFCKENLTKDDKEKDEDSVVPRKKEKMEINYNVKKNRRDLNQQVASMMPVAVTRREVAGSRSRDAIANRRSVPVGREKKRASPEVFGGFDVYNIETAMPKIDLDAIESHLRAAREEERRRRTDREEIRRRLAMGSEADEYYTPGDRPGRKPSLQARLQSGMNLQICFMNETVSDSESPNSDNESSTITASATRDTKQNHQRPPPYQKSSVNTRNRSSNPNTVPSSAQNGQRPVSLPINNQLQPPFQPLSEPVTEADFFARQARLQIEARMALAQAKEMAHMQMEVERQRQKKSPITEMVRSSLEKVGIPFPEERRRVSRQILTEMNVAQLQVIVNDLHTQIEGLNDGLVRFLMDRDDLHMEQDSMLVDIEDLTRYLGAKEQTVKEQKLPAPPQSFNNNVPPPSPSLTPLMAISSSVKPRLHRIASLVKK